MLAASWVHELSEISNFPHVILKSITSVPSVLANVPEEAEEGIKEDNR